MVRQTFAAVECLHMMITYLFLSGHPESAKSAWTMLGMAIRLICAMGLVRNCAKWRVEEKERARRERITWELVSYDLL